MERAGIRIQTVIAEPTGVIVTAAIGAMIVAGIDAVTTVAGETIAAIVIGITAASYSKSVLDASAGGSRRNNRKPTGSSAEIRNALAKYPGINP